MDARRQARVDGMRDALRGFLDVAESLAGDDWDQPTGCPGWSVRDVVAHVCGMEDVLTGGPEPEVEVPDDLPHVTSPISAYTERQVIALRSLSTEDLVKMLALAVDRRTQQLAGDLDAPAPWFLGGERRLIAGLGMRTFDIWVHEQDVRRAIGRPGHLDGPAPRACLDRMLRGLADALPERLQDASGTLDLRVTGAQQGSVVFDVHSGDVLDDGIHASVTMTLDFADFVPLVSGRQDAPDPARVAQVDGDPGLAARVLTSLTITP